MNTKKQQREWISSVLPAADFERVYELHRRSGIAKLMRQLDISAKRINDAHSLRIASFPRLPNDEINEEMLLDVETYYTIAHQLLELASKLMPDDEAKRFKGEPTFRTIAAIRNHLVRHAYGDHRENDPYAGSAWSGSRGVILKGGTSLKGNQDAGFTVNRESLQELLQKYNIQNTGTVAK